MISDILSDALREIERYQCEFPDTYDEIRGEIDSVRTSMSRLREKLDTLPETISEARP